MRGTLAFLLVIEAHRPTTYGPMYSMSYPTYDKLLYYVVHMPWLAYYHVLQWFGSGRVHDIEYVGPWVVDLWASMTNRKAYVPRIVWPSRTLN